MKLVLLLFLGIAPPSCGGITVPEDTYEDEETTEVVDSEDPQAFYDVDIDGDNNTVIINESPTSTKPSPEGSSFSRKPERGELFWLARKMSLRELQKYELDVPEGWRLTTSWEAQKAVDRREIEAHKRNTQLWTKDPLRADLSHEYAQVWTESGAYEPTHIDIPAEPLFIYGVPSPYEEYSLRGLEPEPGAACDFWIELGEYVTKEVVWDYGEFNTDVVPERWVALNLFYVNQEMDSSYAYSKTYWTATRKSKRLATFSISNGDSRFEYGGEHQIAIAGEDCR